MPLIAGTSTIPASISAFLKAVDDAGVKSMIVADGLGWIGEWYKLSGTSSNYVLDQIPGWTTDAAKKFAADFETKYGFTPSPSAAGLSYDCDQLLHQGPADQRWRTSAASRARRIYKTAQDKLWTGQLTYTDGIIMANYDVQRRDEPRSGRRQGPTTSSPSSSTWGRGHGGLAGGLEDRRHRAQAVAVPR